MNRKLYYRSILYLCMLLPGMLLGQETVSKQIEESRDFSVNGSLLIENKYGDIYVQGWDQDELAITIDISATDNDPKEAQALLDRIRPTISGSGNQVIITSEIAKKEAGLVERFFNRSKSGGKKAKSQIDITVYLPNNARVVLTNKYGDVIVSDWDGNLEATVEHGDIRLPDALDSSELSIKYGKLKASALTTAKIMANNATVDVSNATQLNVESKNSEFTLGDIASLTLDSNKDEIEITSMGAISGYVTYSNVVLDNVTESINLNLNLAELRVMKFSDPAPNVRVDQENSEVYMNILNTSFRFRANLEQGVLRIPKTMQDINSTLLDKKKKIRDISATYGSEKQTVFSFTGRKGVIILKEL
ncbi:hypothetical protein POV27_01340 [Aureisphaera galaxeae]|uniref:hypothetical protein n=1 Tax=Aureisphaera galaxeae TaxID=1538023 RepID=UPI00234FC64B|nr:hypothetical protein [Aureisphaera galaxeae]MDC8002682.1 hypothetical protein [Aureisphaera galaxeae]